MKRRKSRAPCPVWGNVPLGYGRGHMAMRVAGLGNPAPSILHDEIRNGFMRGFIAAGLIAATAPEGIQRKEALRLALQGGTALAAGIAGANAIDRRDYGSVMLALAAGAAGLTAINYALPISKNIQSERKDNDHEQEKT